MKTRPLITYDTLLRIDGTPALIQAGTLHYFRLPHPDLWLPVLQRMRGGGLNAVSVPFPWAYHSPAAGLYDFTGPRDVQRLLNEIETAGLWLIAEVGPWIEADLNAGGLPSWFVNMPTVHPDCASDVPAGPSFAFLHSVREWWERLLPFLSARPNLLLLTVDPGPGAELPRYTRALVEMAQELGATGPFAAPLPHLAADDDVSSSGTKASILPLQRIDRGTLLDEAQDSTAAGLHQLEIAPPFTWNSASRESWLRQLDAEHPRLLISRLLGRGATYYTLAPTHSGVNWGYWGMADACAAYGVGAPLEEGATLTAAYFPMRQMALTVETLGHVLTAAQSAATVYATESSILRATRTGNATTVAFLDTANAMGTATRLSLPFDATILTTSPFTVPQEAARILPLRWPIPGGYVLTTTLEPVLLTTVAGRHLLALTNENGGDLLLSEDFRPRHARGPVRTQRAAMGLAIHFAAARWISLLLDGPEGALQLLALEPQLAARVWPLDDAWRTTPAYPAAWHPAPETPTRGLIIGPDWVLPQADGSYIYGSGEKGSGYRWGPWRGSDPHTWLAPLAWHDAPAVTLPPLIWESRPAAPEVAPEYDDSLWTPVVLDDIPLAVPMSDGFTWYRGHFEGAAGQITLRCDQASDIFCNGALIATLNTPPHTLPGAPKTLPLPQHLLHRYNTLAVLVENSAQQRDWAATAHTRGLTACTLDSGAPIRWRSRWGLSGECTVQGFAGYANWALVPEDGVAHITWHRAIFALSLPDDVEMPLFLFLDQAAGRAYLYLNGQLIGRYADNRAPQHRFWLPEGLLRRHGENELLIAQWTRGAPPGLGVARLEHGPLMQWHTPM